MRLKSADLRQLDERGQEDKLKQLAWSAHAPVNGELRDVDERIRTYERQYEVRSETMRQRVASGEMPETWDVCQWLHLLNLRTRLHK